MSVRALIPLVMLGWLLLRAGPAALGQGIPCRYEVAAIIQAPDCPSTGANPTAALGISPNGRYVCGVHGQCDKFGEAFVYDMQTGGVLHDSKARRHPGSAGQRCDDTGLVAGTANSPTGGFIDFVYDLQSGNWTNLPALNGAAGHSFASGVNNAGTVCGSRSIGSKGDPLNPRTAFIWNTTDGFTDLGLVNGHSTFAADLNQAGTVTGTMAVDGVNHPFIWNNGILTDLGSVHGEETVAWGINEEGEEQGDGRGNCEQLARDGGETRRRIPGTLWARETGQWRSCTRQCGKCTPRARKPKPSGQDARAHKVCTIARRIGRKRFSAPDAGIPRLSRFHMRRIARALRMRARYR